MNNKIYLLFLKNIINITIGFSFYLLISSKYNDKRY